MQRFFGWRHQMDDYLGFSVTGDGPTSPPPGATMGRLFSLTYPTAAVLLAVHHGHRYGFDVMDATGLPDGTVYPILRRLERRGVLEGAWEREEVARVEQRPARRYYGLTSRGEEALREVTARFPALTRLFETGPETA
jgi:PadR family transcriptional regulator PadR